MTPRHSDGQAERLSDAHRGAMHSMYMRAEARRAAETPVAGPVATVRRRPNLRRRQLTVLAVLWVLIAGVTLLVGLYWRTPRVATIADAAPATTTAAPAAPTPAAARPRPAPVAPIAVSRVAPEAVAVKRTAPEPPITKPEPAVRLTATAAPRPAPVATPRRVVAAASTVRAASTTAPARLVVTTNPAGALVTVDGIGWGATPARIRYLPPGAKRVRVTKDGYASQERVVRVGDGGSAAVHIVLRPES